MPQKVTQPSQQPTELDEFLAALRKQESGGNYKIVNSIGAMGAYQIMPKNLPSWSQQTFGHSISRSEFLSHPDEQDAIARHINAPRVKKYGAAGAAALWYSGQPDPTKTYGHPPVYKYVQSVLALMGKSGAVTGGKGGSSATPADDVSGSAVHTAGLQQAGYDAQIKLSDFGIPINPFKLPGWLDGALTGGVEAYGGEAGKALGGAVGGLAGGMWDAVGPLILSGIGVAAGAGIVLLGLYVTARPAIQKTTEQAAQLAPLAAL
jgi:hypothetical protein